MIAGTFMTLEMLIVLVGSTSTSFFKQTPSTNANISSHYHTHFGKILNS